MRETYGIRQITMTLLLVAGIHAGILQGNTASAATFYVATTGNDGSPGTKTQPFRTIKHGVGMMGTGDRLYIRAGTYDEGINSNELTIPTGTSWKDAPRIAAYPKETVVLRGTYGNGINLAASYIQYVIFDRLIVDGGGVSVQEGANHIRFQNGEVRNVLGQGIQGGFGNTTTTHLQLINMKIHHNGDPTEGPTWGGRLDHGLYVAIQNLLIDGCEVYENTGYGIQIYDQNGGNASNAIIRNSRIYNNHGDGGVVLSYGNNIRFYNNIVYNNPNGGVQVNYNATNAKIYNNTIYNHQEGVAVYVGAEAYNTAVRNNILYKYAWSLINDGGGTVESHNLTTDPKFVNPAAHNFKLQATSPAINAGRTLTVVTTDIEQLPRPSGATYDIGAHENQN